MQAEGLETLADFESLAVNGFREPLLRISQPVHAVPSVSGNVH